MPTREFMTLIYLDQNIWSLLARRPADPLVAGLLPVLRGAVSGGGALCPVAMAHLMETAKWRAPRDRAQTAALMAKLSQGVCLPMFTDVIAAEASGSTLEPGDVTAAFPRGTLRPNTVDALRTLDMEDRLISAIEMLASDETTRRSIATYDAQMLAGFGAHLPLGAPLSPGRFGTMLTRLLAVRLADKRRKAKENDGRDLLHVSHALTCDLIILERSHAELARSAGHPGVYRRDVDGSMATWVSNRLAQPRQVVA